MGEIPNYDAARRLYQLSRFTRKVVREILRGTSRAQILNSFTRIMVESGSFAMCAVAWHNPETHELVTAASFGDHHGYLRNIQLFSDQRPEGLGPAGIAFRESRTCVIHDFLADPRTQTWAAQAQLAGFRSSAAIPIQISGVTVAILGVYARETNYFGPDEIELMEEVALDLSFALENLERENHRTLMEGRLQQAIRVARIGIFDHNIVDNTIYWSPELRHIHGFTPDEPPLLATGYNCIHPDDRERILEAISEEHNPAGTGLFQEEYRLLLPDGTVKWVSTRARAFFENGTAVRSVGALVDITAPKIAEAERLQLETNLAQAQKMESIGRLAGGVAHDFNNMLTVILGYAAMARTELNPSAPIARHIDEIEKAANRSIEMTQQLLGFSRQQVISPTPANLNHIVAALQPTLARLIGEDISLSFFPDPNLWTVLVDASQINRILLNLAVNARDAMPNGGKLTIETSNFDVSPEYAQTQPGLLPGKYTILAVSDSGQGIDPQTLPRIFEPFFTTKPQGKGTGLGLSTVYGIVKQNEGFIAVYSEPDHGTTFRVYLPRQAGAPEPEPAKPPVPPPATGRGTVLLVEDDDLVRGMTTMILKRLGYTPLLAETPQQALEICSGPDQGIRLMLTDVVMPGMNGMELRERVLALKPALKILLMSGYTSNVILSHGVLKPGVNFIQKPFSIEELSRRIEETLASA